MGLSAASLHLLRPAPGADLTSAVTAAYKKLGYSKAKDDGSGPRGVALVDRGDFVSIHDSGNDTLDTGELRELAVILSKSTKSVAIVTTVNDSDVFEFLLFHRGKQIDAALSEPPSDEAGVTVREGNRGHSRLVSRRARWRGVPRYLARVSSTHYRARHVAG